MSDILCIRFREAQLSPLSPLAWVLLSPQGELLQSGHCLLQQLNDDVPPKNGPRKTTLIAPNESLLLTKIAVPEAQRRHLKQILPFIVEEQIIDPVESMHLAVPSLVMGEQLLVGCVKKDQLSHWLALFKEIDIEPDQLFSDVMCLPKRDSSWHILFDQGRALLHLGQKGEVMSCSTNNLSQVLDIVLAQTTALDDDIEKPQVDNELNNPSAPLYTRPHAITLFSAKPEDYSQLLEEQQALLTQAELKAQRQLAEATAELIDDSAIAENNQAQEPAVQDDALQENADQETTAPIDIEQSRVTQSESAIENQADIIQQNENYRNQLAEYIRSENIDAEVMNLSETVTEALAITSVLDFQQETQLNFLQGDFTPINTNAEMKRFVSRVIMTSAACVALFFLVTLFGGFYLNMKADDYHAKNVAIYKELFPKQRRVRDPVRQMKNQLRGGAVVETASDFLPLLDVASKSMQVVEEKNQSETTIKQLRYDAQRGSINMELETESIDQLEMYRDLLSSEGLDVDILSAKQNSGIVNGRIQIGRS